MEKEEVVQKINKYTKKLLVDKKESFNGRNNFAYFDKDGDLIRKKLGQPCYMQINQRLERPCHYFWDWAMLHNDVDEATSKYYQWLSKESAWSPVFVGPYSLGSAKNQGVLFSCDFPTAFIVQAGMLVRYINEYSTIVHNWFRFQKYMEPHLALRISHNFSITGNTVLRTFPQYNGHNAFSQYHFELNHIQRMIDKEPVFLEKTPMKKTITRYSPLSAIWSKKKENVQEINTPAAGISVTQFAKQLQEMNNV